MNASNVFKNMGNALGKVAAQLHSFVCSMKPRYRTLVLVVIVAVASVAVTSLVAVMLSSSDDELYLPSLGTIKTVEVETYWDQDCKNRRENLTWDDMWIQQMEEAEVNEVNTTVYIKSVSNLKVTLTMFLTDWNPEDISDYVTISWDYDGTVLSPNEVIPVTMTLSASSTDDFIDYLIENEVTRFDVAVHIVGSE